MSRRTRLGVVPPTRRAGHLLVLLLIVAAVLAPSSSAARLQIPRLGLDRQTQPYLDAGPRLWWQDHDTVAIAGHRTTHGAPFRRLDELRPGDVIRLDGDQFVVRRLVSVPSSSTWPLRFKGLVLSACDPPGSAARRLVVLAAPRI